MVAMAKIFILGCTLLIATSEAIITDPSPVNLGLASPMPCSDGQNRTVSIDERKVCVICTYPGQVIAESPPHRCEYFYRQGPCQEGRYLISYMENDGDCIPNPCEEDGLVRIRDGCVPYDVNGACGPGYVAVPDPADVNNHVCQRVLLKRQWTIYRKMGSRCPQGHTRDLQGICRQRL